MSFFGGHWYPCFGFRSSWKIDDIGTFFVNVILTNFISCQFFQFELFSGSPERGW